jgi:hypothetical protein
MSWLRYSFSLLIFGTCIEAQAADKAKVPAPIAQYAQQFEEECQANRLGALVTSDNYTDRLLGPVDLNEDGAQDYE